MLKFEENIIKILESDTNDLRELAKISGKDFKKYYRGAKFVSIDLNGRDLTGWDLSYSIFDKCVLDNVNFSECVFEGAHFVESSISGGNFSYCEIDGTKFDKTDLARANFSGAKINNTEFKSLNLDSTLFDNDFNPNLQSSSISSDKQNTGLLKTEYLKIMKERLAQGLPVNESHGVFK